MDKHANNLDCVKMNDVKDVLRIFGVQSDYLRVIVSVNGIFFLEYTDGLFLVNVVDQNGAAVHCIFIDAGRKVIIDPANEK